MWAHGGWQNVKNCQEIALKGGKLAKGGKVGGTTVGNITDPKM